MFFLIIGLEFHTAETFGKKYRFSVLFNSSKVDRATRVNKATGEK